MFEKLSESGCPDKLFNVLNCWLCKWLTAINWNGHLSKYVAFIFGVRQGSILSLVLFAVYVNNILNSLHSVNLGCYVHYLVPSLTQTNLFA